MLQDSPLPTPVHSEKSYSQLSSSSGWQPWIFAQPQSCGRVKQVLVLLQALTALPRKPGAQCQPSWDFRYPSGTGSGSGHWQSGVVQFSG